MEQKKRDKAQKSANYTCNNSYYVCDAPIPGGRSFLLFFFFFLLLINSVMTQNSLLRQSNMSGLSR